MSITTYGPYTAFDVLYDLGGHPVDPANETALLTWLTSDEGKKITDLVVISHGWNNDIDDARALYTNFFQAMGQVQKDQASTANKKFAVMSIFWPSKKFADADLISGGAAGLASPVDNQLNAQLDQLKLVFAALPEAAAAIEHARQQIASLEVSQSAQNDFIFALTSLLPAAKGPVDEGLDEALTALKSGALAGHTVLARLAAPIFPAFPHPGGSNMGGAGPVLGGGIAPAGHALGIGSVLGGIKGAATRFANILTYATMKDRAALVGQTGVLQTVLHLQAAFPNLPIHIAGHSFGCRVVTAMANSLTQPKTIASMLLMEAAYSHYGMAQDWDGKGSDGAFRAVVAQNRIAGPILITHSVHDSAVGLAYPLASRILSQVASAVGDANDKFGGMGRNGAQKTPEAFDDTLLPAGTAYKPLPAGKTIRNLNGDGPLPQPTILGHSDIGKPEIAWAWLSSL